jgi:hypothetical protein
MDEGKCSSECKGCILAHKTIAEFKDGELENNYYVMNRYEICKFDDVKCNVFKELQNCSIPLEQEARSNPILLAYVKIYQPINSYICVIPATQTTIFFEETDDLDDFEIIRCCESCKGCNRAIYLINEYITEQKKSQELNLYNYQYAVQKKNKKNNGNYNLYPNEQQICCIFNGIDIRPIPKAIVRSDVRILAYIELYEPTNYQIETVYAEHTDVSFYKFNGCEKITVHTFSGDYDNSYITSGSLSKYIYKI